LTKRIKPDKPLRDSLVSHRAAPEEEVLTLATRIQAIVEGREILFFSILVGALVVIGGTGLVWFLKSNEESMARERLSVAYAAYRDALYVGPSATRTPVQNVDPALLLEKAEAMAVLAEEHAGSRSGALSSYLAGNAYLRAGSPEKAVPLLQAATENLDRGSPAGAFALEALGYAQEAQGRPDLALDAFTALSQVVEPRFRLEGLLGRARALSSQGKEEAAQEAREAALAEFPDAVGSAPRPPLNVQVQAP
jgi:tetratricopeptide (TPR) repeat protein